MKLHISRMELSFHYKVIVIFSMISIFCLGTISAQKNMIPYDGTYRAGHLRFKQIYSQRDLMNLDVENLPVKKIDYYLNIDATKKWIAITPASGTEKWTYYHILKNPKFESFIDDSGNETIISEFEAIDNFGQGCSLGLSIWNSDIGSYRLVIYYPNKMIKAYDFVKSSDWDQYEW